MGSLRQNLTHKEVKCFIVGTVLGDGHLSMLKSNARLELIQSEKQKDFLFWKYKILKKYTGSSPYRTKVYDNRYEKNYYRWQFKTHVDPLFTELYSEFYPNDSKKVVPNCIAKLLNLPIGLAVWFMDDGGRRNDCYGLFLNTLSFTQEGHKLLVDCLYDNFGIKSRLHWIQDGYRIYIPSKEAKRFCEIVDPYIIPSMKYKLSYDPVTTSFARLDRARDRR